MGGDQGGEALAAHQGEKFVDPVDPHVEPIMKTAAESGIGYLKLGYWHYEGFGGLRSQMDEIRQRLSGLEALAKRYGVRSMHPQSLRRLPLG